MEKKEDLRYSRFYGWDRMQPVPKVGDLVIITTDSTSEKGKLVRLCEDRADRQTVEVTDDLETGYGCHTRFNRRGQIRAVTARDEFILKER